MLTAIPLSTNQIHYEYADIYDLVIKSPVIIAVKTADPCCTWKKIPVRCSIFKTAPPYERLEIHYIVKKIIKSEKSSLKDIPAPGSRITVLNAGEPRLIDDYKDYYCKGISKSPVIVRYKDGVSTKKGEDAVIFIVYSEETKSWQFSIDNAVADIAQIQLIEKIAAGNYSENRCEKCWISDHAVQISGIGKSSIEEKNRVKKRNQAKESAVMDARRRAFRLLADKDYDEYIRGKSSDQNDPWSGLLMGQIIQEQYDADDNCIIQYRIEKMGLKKTAADLRSRYRR